MSVIIKGMEMPRSCTLCALLKNDRSSFYCPVQNKEANLKANLLIELYANCPLSPVPPHGRLIDADELYTIYADLLDGGDVKAVVPKIVIDTSPTIIPADKEGE